MPEFDRLAEAARHAMPLGQEKCGTCKHFVKQPPRQPGEPPSGECREHLRGLNLPMLVSTPDVRDIPIDQMTVGDLTVKELCTVIAGLVSVQTVGAYLRVPEQFPACGRYVRRLEVT